MTISYDILHKSKNDVENKETIDHVRVSKGSVINTSLSFTMVKL